MVAFSCSDKILDISPMDRVSENAVWTDEKLINAYHTELYNCVMSGHIINMQSKTTDEAFCSITFGPGIIPAGSVTADNITDVENTQWHHGGNIYYWGTGWQYLRKINVFLDKMGTTTLDIANKPRLIAEAKFLRAYIYFEFIKRFGGVPIITGTYDLTQASGNFFHKSFIRRLCKIHLRRSRCCFS